MTRVSIWMLDRPPTPFELLVLEEPEQLDLERGAQFANLVQEQRAAAGRFDPALALRVRPRECSLLVTNNSLSRSVSGIAPQLMATNGPSLRPLWRWMARAAFPCQCHFRRGSGRAHRGCDFADGGEHSCIWATGAEHA